MGYSDDVPQPGWDAAGYDAASIEESHSPRGKVTNPDHT
jgi:hypothetical protein